MRQCVKPVYIGHTINGDLAEKTDTFDPVCFLYASLLRISKAKTMRRTLSHLPYADTNKNFRKFREIEN